MSQNCCESSSNIMILACSGGSNVGQLTNQAAVELTKEGFGKMFCLAGIGGQLSGFVQSAKEMQVLVVIDGCPVGCGQAILENALVPMERYLVITDEGIEKNKNFDLKRADIDRVKAAVKRVVNEKAPKVSGLAAGGCSCGGKC